MNTELCIGMCRVVFKDKPWVLFENGTVLLSDHLLKDAAALKVMKAFDAMIGPYGGEGSPLGDVNPMKLKAFDGWLVGFEELPLVTFVGEDEKGAAPTSSTEVFQVGKEQMWQLRVGLLGRHKRNMDVRDPKIVARWSDE